MRSFEHYPGLPTTTPGRLDEADTRCSREAESARPASAGGLISADHHLEDPDHGGLLVADLNVG